MANATKSRFDYKLETFIHEGCAKIRELYDNVWNAALQDERLYEAECDPDYSERELFDTVNDNMWNLFYDCDRWFSNSAKAGQNSLNELLQELETELLNVLDDNFIEYSYLPIYQAESIQCEPIKSNQIELIFNFLNH
jgi:hypothetical protein